MPSDEIDKALRFVLIARGNCTFYFKKANKRKNKSKNKNKQYFNLIMS